MKIISTRKKGDETEALQKTIREQKARIEDLKRENADLLFTLDEYTKKENSILESIGYLEEKKREQNEKLNRRYAAELEKLRFFEEKWLNIIRNSDDPTLKKSVAHTRETLMKCREEILKTTRRELRITQTLSPAEEDYENETARLNAVKNATDLETEDFDPAEYIRFRKMLKDAADEERKTTELAQRRETEVSESDDLPPETFEESFKRRFGVDLVRPQKAAKPLECLTEPDKNCPARNPLPKIEEPDSPSPRKMSDEEIVSLLEKFSL